jgi:hypothetical protein
MRPYIDAAKASSIGLLSTLDSSGSDYRVAVTEYKDFPIPPYGRFGDYPYRAILPFSTDEEVIQTALNGITVGGGGDLPESAYSGLIGTLLTDGINDWRQNSEKVLIVLTDAPPHSPEPFTGYVASDVIDLAYSIDPAIIYSIVVGSNPSTYNFFAELSQRTGGRVYRSESFVGLEDLFLNVINDVVNDVTDKSKSQSVPEPASIFSLLAFGAFSASSCKRNRKKQQN